MNLQKSIDFLLEKGGPAIKLRMMNEGLIDKGLYSQEQLTNELLEIEQIEKRLGYLDAFNRYEDMTHQELGRLIHNCYDNCYEIFMPLLINAGLRAGNPVLDERIKPMRGVYLRVGEKYNACVPMVWIPLLKAGYIYDDMITSMADRLNLLHKTAVNGTFDFYETDPAKIREYSRWKDKLIVKDRHSPYGGELPMPLLYDITPALYMYDYFDNDTKQKLDEIMDFIFDPRYQENHGDCGWHWAGEQNTYHASSPGVDIPFIPLGENAELHPSPISQSHELRRQQHWGFLGLIETMLCSPKIRHSGWMRYCADYLGQYAAEHGTYSFPFELLSSVFHKTNLTTMYALFIAKEKLTETKPREHKPLVIELYSTYFIAVMMNRMKGKPS